jgi:hypothetical protein
VNLAFSVGNVPSDFRGFTQSGVKMPVLERAAFPAKRFLAKDAVRTNPDINEIFAVGQGEEQQIIPNVWYDQLWDVLWQTSTRTLGAYSFDLILGLQVDLSGSKEYDRAIGFVYLFD